VACSSLLFLLPLSQARPLNGSIQQSRGNGRSGDRFADRTSIASPIAAGIGDRLAAARPRVSPRALLGIPHWYQPTHGDRLLGRGFRPGRRNTRVIFPRYRGLLGGMTRQGGEEVGGRDRIVMHGHRIVRPSPFFFFFFCFPDHLWRERKRAPKMTGFRPLGHPIEGPRFLRAWPLRR